MAIDPIIVVGSKSGPGARSYLSTMKELAEPLKMWGLRFRSIEHAFAAAKYMFLASQKDGDPTSRPYLMAMFAVGGAYGDLPPKKAKGLAGKAAFKRKGVVLDVPRWNECRFGIMDELIKARAAVDPLFVKYLTDLRGVQIFHAQSARFKRPEGPEKKIREAYAQKLIWGVTFRGQKKIARNAYGNNAYGKALMAFKLPECAEAQRIKDSLKRTAGDVVSTVQAKRVRH